MSLIHVHYKAYITNGRGIIADILICIHSILLTLQLLQVNTF